MKKIKTTGNKGESNNIILKQGKFLLKFENIAKLALIVQFLNLRMNILHNNY